MKKIYVLLAVLCFSCSIEQTDKNPEILEDGFSSLTISDSDGECITLSTGLDLNRNNILEEEEIENTEVICSEVGLISLIDILKEDGCERINVGLDLNRDDILQEVEITNTQLICPIALDNGLNTLLSFTSVSDTICDNGGLEVSSGLDSNNNGVLDPNEITDVSIICNGLNDQSANGEDGLDSLINVVDELEGENCEFGGIQVQVGLDDNKDGVLQFEEIDDIAYVCSVKCVKDPICKLEVKDTDHCENTNNYVIWMQDLNGKAYYFQNVSLVYNVYENTAKLYGVVNSGSLGDWYLDVIFSKAATVSDGQAKNHKCYNVDSSNFTYYLNTEGTFKQLSGTGDLEIVRTGEAFQFGIGANITEENTTKNSASGWFMTDDHKYLRGDINITFEETCD